MLDRIPMKRWSPLKQLSLMTKVRKGNGRTWGRDHWEGMDTRLNSKSTTQLQYSPFLVSKIDLNELSLFLGKYNALLLSTRFSICSGPVTDAG